MMQATEETKRVSLPALFAEIQVLKEEHSRLILHIENERDARRAAILETEQMKVTIAEHNKRIESLLVLKARTEISVVEAREEFAFLATERTAASKAMECLREEMIQVREMLHNLREGFIDGMKGLYSETRYLTADGLALLEGDILQQKKELDKEMEGVQSRSTQFRKSIELSKQQHQQLLHLETMQRELQQNIEGIESSAKSQAASIVQIQEELEQCARLHEVDGLLRDMKEVKEQGVYWRDLRTSLDMQYTTQQKKLDHIHACLKDIETRGETPTFSQPRNRTLPPTWKERSTNVKIAYTTASDCLATAASSQPQEQPDIRKNKRTFHPLYPDESPEKKEEDSDESLMNPLW